LSGPLIAAEPMENRREVLGISEAERVR